MTTLMQSTSEAALGIAARSFPLPDLSGIGEACATTLGTELSRSKPGPKPPAIRLIVRTPRGPNAKPIYYVKKPGQQAYSTGIRVDDVKAVNQLMQLLQMQQVAVRMGRMNPGAIAIDVVISFWIGASRPLDGAPEKEKKRYRDAVAKWKLLRLFFKGRTFADLDEAACKAYADWRTGETDDVPGVDDPLPCPKTCGSLSTVHGDLILLHQAIQMFKAKHNLAWAPTLYIPPKSGRRLIWLKRDEVARIVWAIRGRIWDHGTGAWATEEYLDPDTGETKVGYVRRSAYERAVRKILFRFLLIGVLTGTRHTALINLRWTPDPDHGYFDLERGVIHRAGHSEDPAEGKPRMSSYVTAKLLWWLCRWSASDLALGIDNVIHKRDGTAYRTHLRDLWNAVVADAGLGADVVPHVMRHTCCTWLKLSRVDVQTAADMVGMHPKTLTTIYGQWSIEGSRWAADALADPVHIKAIGTKVRVMGKITDSVAPPRFQHPRRKLRPMTAETRKRISVAMAGVWRRRTAQH